MWQKESNDIPCWHSHVGVKFCYCSASAMSIKTFIDTVVVFSIRLPYLEVHLALILITSFHTSHSNLPFGHNSITREGKVGRYVLVAAPCMSSISWHTAEVTEIAWENITSKLCHSETFMLSACM